MDTDPRGQSERVRDGLGRGLSVASVGSTVSTTSAASELSTGSSVQFASPPAQLPDDGARRGSEERSRTGRSRSGSLASSINGVLGRDDERGRSRSRTRTATHPHAHTHPHPHPHALHGTAVPFLNILHSFRPFGKELALRDRGSRDASRDSRAEMPDRGRRGRPAGARARSPSANSQRKLSSGLAGIIPSISVVKNPASALRSHEPTTPTQAPSTRSRSVSRADVHRRSVSLERVDSLRHRDLPGGFATRESPSFVRVYRPDGTFGTIACPGDIRADKLLQLAVRKFFISDASECRLMAVFPESITALEDSMRPVQIVKDMLITAGYHSVQDKLVDVCRDDTSFVCRIVLASINLPLRPPVFIQAPSELIVTNTDVTDAPSLVCSNADNVRLLDVSRSAFQQSAIAFPSLDSLKLERMFGLVATVPNAFLMPLSLSSTARSLQSLSLARNGLTSLSNVDFTFFPMLSHIDLRGNQLTELPASLLHLPFLKVLDCGTNGLVHFDTWNPSLQVVKLGYNRFERLNLTHDQALQMVNLKVLQLCANSLETLPEALQLLPSLRDLDVRHNLIANPMTAMVPTLHRLVASYNNPKPLTQKAPDASTRTEVVSLTDDDKLPVYYVPLLRELKLEGLQMLKVVGRVVLQSVTVLDMRNTHLPFIDEDLFTNAPNLRVLNLRNNNLSRIPGSIGTLSLLEELNVSSNDLVDLPEELFTLSHLHTLDAHANNLKVITSKVWQMPSLRVLNISSNLIDSLPAHPASLAENRSSASLCFSPLKSVVACDNQLSEDVFEILTHIPTLRTINLSYNYIGEMPNSFFAKLPLVEELYLSGNRLNTLPHEDFDYASNLRVLLVNSNKLHTLPAELSKTSRLEMLDVSWNSLRYNVGNWPYDWNWRWNKELRYLNFSCNRRLEIKRAIYPSAEIGEPPDSPPYVDLADFCVLPKLSNLGLMDVTLTTGSVPFQTESCRVRTYGSDLENMRIGIADTLGSRPLAINDLVVDRFRNKPDEFLVAMFDGVNEPPANGNKISHLAQETFATLFKAELESDPSVVDALRRAFLATHREIGNTAMLSPEEMAHSFLGHHCSTAQRLGPDDWHAGTGATVLYIRGSQLWVATVGGARVLLSRGNGEHGVASKPLPPVAAELDRIRAAGGIVDPKRSYVDDVSPFPRIIGCYAEGTSFSAAPSIYEYDLMTGLDPNDQIIIGSAAIWETLRHETAADIVRSSAADPMLAALKLRDFAMAYGMVDRAMVMVLGRPYEEVNRHNSQGELNDGELGVFRKRWHSLPADSNLARLGFEVSPPFGEVTMVFTDIRNSTYLWENYPAVMRAAIKTHNSLMRRSVRLMEGYEVKNEGDAFMICFHTPIKALIWCLTVQQHLLTAEWPPDLITVPECAPVHDENGELIFRGLSVRIGIHCGRPVAEPDPVTRRMDYFGPMVNRTSRISGIAEGGQISVSSDFLSTLQRGLDAHKAVLQGASPETAYDWLSAEMAEALERSALVLDHHEYVVDELGELKLRGIENPEHIFNIYPKSLQARRKWYADRDRESQKNRLTNSYSGSDSAVSSSGIDPITQIGETLRNINVDFLQQAAAVGSDSSLDSPTSPMSSRSNRPSLASIMDGRGSEVGLSSVPKIHHQHRSMHLNPQLNPHLNPQLTQQLSPQLSAMFRDPPMALGDSVGGTPLSTPSLEMPPPPMPSEPQQRQPSIVVDPLTPISGLDDPLQTLCHRLEAICAAVTTSTPLAEHRELLKRLEPGVPAGSAAADLAQPVWMTLALARLREIYASGGTGLGSA